jgi:hypothetical protein
MAKALLFENSEKIVSSERVLLINITEIIHCFLKANPGDVHSLASYSGNVYKPVVNVMLVQDETLCLKTIFKKKRSENILIY